MQFLHQQQLQSLRHHHIKSQYKQKQLSIEQKSGIFFTLRSFPFLLKIVFSWMYMSYIEFLSSWVFHVFVHGSDIRLSFSKLPLIRIHIIWPTKLIYAKQEESFWHDYVFLGIDLDCLWTILTITKKMKPKLFILAQG